MKNIPLTQGKIAIVDDEDYVIINQHKWFAVRSRKIYYARTWIKTDSGKILMPIHRFIMNPDKHVLIDHINGDGLDNRRCNLRICNYITNQRNRRITIGSSRFKGVCWHKLNNKWRARIRINCHLKDLGCFDSELAAAKSYDQAAILYFGNFARINFPNKENSLCLR